MINVVKLEPRKPLSFGPPRWKLVVSFRHPPKTGTEHEATLFIPELATMQAIIGSGPDTYGIDRIEITPNPDFSEGSA